MFFFDSRHDSDSNVSVNSLKTFAVRRCYEDFCYFLPF